MPVTFANPHRGRGLDLDAPFPCSDASGVMQLLGQCPAHAETALLDLPELAARCGVAQVYLKDERNRMGLGSFKALGAAHAIARAAADRVVDNAWQQALVGQTYVTASAGNHGLSVAAGAALFGARAVVYLAETVPESFAARLRAKGAEVVRAGHDYEASMAGAEIAAEVNGWTLLSDSSWPGYVDLPYLVMEGYLQLAQEAATQIPQHPTHILLQAGVGGWPPPWPPMPAGPGAMHRRSSWWSPKPPQPWWRASAPVRWSTQLAPSLPWGGWIARHPR